jgi:CelD/BcsL family acetyltransferase involved in cellulose biosynthesis
MTAAIVCHYNEIPAYVAHELDRLYGTRYATMPHFRHYGDTVGVHTYVVRSNEEAVTVFLFRCVGPRVFVLNEGILVGQEEAATFADYVFHVFPATRVICFHCIETAAAGHRPPFVRLRCAQDLMLPLPPDCDSYFASLGASTRKLLRHRQNRLRHDFPSFTFRVCERDDVREADVRAIIGLNRQRMAGLDKASSIDADEEERIVRYVHDCGFVALATINGKLCAGAINYRIGRHFSARILSHDPAYDEYRLGFICAYLSVCECIKQAHHANFYFGWGDNPYKYSLGAVPRALSHLLVFRSYGSMLRHAGMLVANCLAAWKFQLRQGLLNAARRGDGTVASSLAGKLVGWVRAFKPRS